MKMTAFSFFTQILEMNSFTIEKILLITKNTKNSYCTLILNLLRKALMTKQVIYTIVQIQVMHCKTIIIKRICCRKITFYLIMTSLLAIFSFLCSPSLILVVNQKFVKFTLFLNLQCSTPIKILMAKLYPSQQKSHISNWKSNTLKKGLSFNPPPVFYNKSNITQQYESTIMIIYNCIKFQILIIFQLYYIYFNFSFYLNYSTTYFIFSITFPTINND